MTQVERQRRHDPRPSIEERYATPQAYVDAVRLAADRLVTERMLLPEDATAMTAAAEAGRLAR